MNKTILIVIAAVFVFVIAFLSGVFNPQETNIGDNMEERIVKQGDTISVHYTGKFPEGEVFDSSVGKQPLTFVVGSGQLIQGFDEAVVGMKVGETKTVEIPPEKAYGPEGSGHQLAGKTLIFEIQIVEIKE